MRGLPIFLSPFRNELNKFNNTGARMLDSFYHMALNLLKIASLACKHQYFAIFHATLGTAYYLSVRGRAAEIPIHPPYFG